MDKKTVIVTGVSRGLGAAIVRLLVQAGANVVINGRSKDELVSVAREFENAGFPVHPVVGDLVSPTICQVLVTTAINRFGGLDAVVNNAGIIEPIALIAESTRKDWEQNLAINLLAPITLLQQAIPHLRTRTGRVINISSGAAIKEIPAWAAYCTAKAALNHFSRVLTVEEPSITTISLRPGTIDTAMQAVIRQTGAPAMPKSWHDHFLRTHREGDLLPPELPGRAAAVLSLYAPHEWSGEFISWDDARVQALVQQYLPG